MTSSEPNNPTRKLRPSPENNALIVGILLLLASTANIIVNTGAAIQSRTWQSVINAIAPAIIAIMCVILIILSRRNKAQQSGRLIVIVIIFTLITRTLMIQGLGLIFGIAAAAVVSLVGFLTLPPRQAGNMILVGLGSGVAIIVVDALWPFPRPAATGMLTTVAYITAIAVIVIFGIIFATQFRRFGLYSKILLGFTLIAILPVIIVGHLSDQLTRSTLVGSSNRSLLSSAGQTAQLLESFISFNKEEVGAASQSSVFSDFLTAKQTGSPDLNSFREKAYSSLQSYRRRNQVFIKSCSILDMTGLDVLDTDPNKQGMNENMFDYVSQTINSGIPVVSSVYVTPDGKSSLIFSSPIRNSFGEMIGIFRISYNAVILQKIVVQQNGSAGESSYGILIDENNTIIANGMTEDLIFKTISPLTPERVTALQSRSRLPSGSGDELSAGYVDLEQKINTGSSIFSFVLPGVTSTNEAAAVVPVPSTSWQVIFIQDEEILLAPVREQSRTITLVAAAIVVLAALAAYGVSRLITTPIRSLKSAADQISQGNLSVQAKVNTEDEIGALANTFNFMTARLSDTIDSLETRVNERTQNIEHRSVLLQAAADVGRSAVSTRELDTMLTQVVNLISTRFGYYHVGIFLIDDRAEFAVLKASNSEGGHKMLERNHKLRIGQTGIVGFVTAQGKARIALDVGDDAVFFDNPDLPNTRSEMALPLMTGNTILGALDVQSEQPSAFGDEDIATLQVMADQIAIAIENARLFSEEQSAIAIARRAFRDQSQEGWENLLKEKEEIGYFITAKDKINPISGVPDPDYQRTIETDSVVRSVNRRIIYIPIRVRGGTIGAIRLVKPSDGAWLDNEVELAGILSEQLGSALETARLYNDTIRRSQRQQMIGEITGRIRETLDLDTILQTAVQELTRSFNLNDAEVRLQPQTNKEVPDGTKA